MSYHEEIDRLIYCETELEYSDFKLVVNINKNKNHHIKTLVPADKKFQDGYKAIINFFNEIHWFHDVKISGISSGCHNEYMLSFHYEANKDEYLVRSFKQRIFKEEQHKALAYYREGNSIGSCYYNFLCLYKILEMPFKDSRDLGNWIDAKIANIDDSLLTISAKRIKQKAEDDSSKAKYIREKIRHYLSHGKNMGIESIDYNDFDCWDEVKWINLLLDYLVKDILITKLELPLKI